MKIIDILNQASHCHSFEYYPPKSREKWPEFYQKIARMRALGPSFIDVTWGTGDPTSLATLEIAQNIQAESDIETMMHITCTHRSRTELLDILRHVVRDTSLRNVMALRGNRPPDGPWTPHPEGFQSARDLVAGIRQTFGDTLGISVAAYPEGHREDGLPPDPAFIGTRAYHDQIAYLREKIDAGADFAVTQLCFDLDRLCAFRDDCARAGISCPIVPGILPIHSRQTWDRIAAFSATIPAALARRYAALDSSPESLAQFATDLLAEQMDVLHSHGFHAIHLYTLNHEKILSKALGRA